MSLDYVSWNARTQIDSYHVTYCGVPFFIEGFKERLNIEFNVLIDLAKNNNAVIVKQNYSGVTKHSFYFITIEDTKNFINAIETITKLSGGN
jgi:hypothetical protein